MTTPNDPNRKTSYDDESLDPDYGYSRQASHQRLPSETAEEYHRRRKALELKEEARRLKAAELHARETRTNLLTDRVTNSVYFLVLALEALLALRLVLRLTGANVENTFASFIYDLSNPFVAPFSTLFISPTADEARYIFDVNLLVAMLVYGLLGFLASKLIKVIMGETN